jgi:homoserine O-acetyltransferase
MTCTQRVELRSISFAPSSAELTRADDSRGAAAGAPHHASNQALALASRHPWPVVDRTITFADFALESGQTIARLDVRYRIEGTINAARDNVVLVVHALTGTPEASDWWKGVIGEGEALDPATHAILCANLLGGCVGSSGPRFDDDTLFPAFTTRDQAAVLARLLDELRIDRPALVCGGSLGGMVTLEFAASFPERVRQAVVLAAPAAQTAQGLAWHAIMRRAVALGGTDEGLALARMIGMLSYRTSNSFEARFAREQSTSGVFRINEWLYAHGDKLVQRFDARSYIGLIDAMDAHDCGRGRGGIAESLRPVAARIIGVGIPGDILFSAESVQEWCAASGARYVELQSEHGHDAFLLEAERVSEIIGSALAHSTAECAAEQEVAAEADSIARCIIPVVTEARPIRVAIAGCGHVGGAVLDLFREQNANGKKVEVSAVLVRDASREREPLEQAIRAGLVSRSNVITNPDQLLADNPDVLIELIGGTTTARTIVETALKRGIRVVCANKALLAVHGPSLKTLAALNDTTLEYEGAVAAAVPVIRLLKSGLADAGIQRISGIINGTTNVVLERVSAGESLSDAIRYAQQQGFAEADPTRDLSGEDAEDKLRVLAWLAWGVEPASLRVVRRGIDEATARWAASVAREGDAVKLIASCTYERGTLVARVVPERVPANSDWALTGGPLNRIVIESEEAGTVVLQGPGAGGRATAGAVLADLFSPVGELRS